MKIRKICVIAGVCLLIAATTMLLVWQWRVRTAERNAVQYVDTLRTLLPAPQGAVPEARRDNTMATLSLDGTDFVGLLEMPRFESVLPVCATWENPTSYPCRLSGSVYDRTMQIGLTSQKGQYDFYRDIDVGDTVRFTDTEGNLYTYTVSEMRYEKHADQASLQQCEADLTVFVKNIYGFEYLLLSCNVAK